MAIQQYLKATSTTFPVACKCEKLICHLNGDNIEISCSKCKKTMVIKTGGIKEAIERLVYKQEPIMINLNR